MPTKFQINRTINKKKSTWNLTTPLSTAKKKKPASPIEYEVEYIDHAFQDKVQVFYPYLHGPHFRGTVPTLVNMAHNISHTHVCIRRQYNRVSEWGKYK